MSRTWRGRHRRPLDEVQNARSGRRSGIERSIRRVFDRWIGTAVLSSSAAMADRMLVELLADERFRESPAGTVVIDKLAAIVGSRNRATEVNRVLRALAEEMADMLVEVSRGHSRA